MKKLNFKIEGMHCNSCKLLIEDALLETKGISNVEVSLTRNCASIEYDDNNISSDTIIKIIENEGYEVNR